MTETNTFTSSDNQNELVVWRSVQPGGLIHYTLDAHGWTETDVEKLFETELANIKRQETVIHWRVEPTTTSILRTDAKGHDKTYFNRRTRFTASPNDMALFHKSDIG